LNKLERACADTESRAAAVAKAAKRAERAARRLHKAARAGDHEKIRSAQQELREAAALLEASARTARDAWPFDDEQMSGYLSSGYRSELVEVARAADVEIGELDDRLTAFPVVIQIQPSARAIRLDGRRSSSLRPTWIVEHIKSRKRSSGQRPQHFIEVLYRAYRSSRDTGDAGALLSDIYDLITIHPETRRLYSRADFVRDVFLLDSSDVRETRSGARVAFPAATGTKGGRNVFVAFPQGEMPKHYFGIRFEEASE